MNDAKVLLFLHDIRKQNVIIVSVLLSALIIDTIFSNLSDLITKQLSSIWGVSLFMIISLGIMSSGLFLLLEYAKQASKNLRTKKPTLNIIYKMVLVIQFVLIGIILFTSIQLILRSEYYVPLLVTASQLGYGLVSIVMGLLSYTFFSWYRAIYGKKNTVILLWALASALTSATAASASISQNGLLLESHVISVGPESQVIFPTNSPDPTGIMAILLSLSYYIAITAYLLAWGACVFLLYHYSKRSGRVKYLILLPFAFFLFNVPTLIGGVASSSFFSQNMVAFRITTISGFTAISVLFGVAFLLIIRSISQRFHGNILDYLYLSAFGITLLFVSLLSNIAHGAYPPFGMASYSITGLASYLFMTGIYSSANSIAQDSRLRRIIRDSTIEESKLLDSIGTASMEQEIQSKVLNLAKQQKDTLTHQTGVESSLTEDEIKQYLQEVLEEVKIKKPKREF